MCYRLQKIHIRNAKHSPSVHQAYLHRIHRQVKTMWCSHILRRTGDIPCRTQGWCSSPWNWMLSYYYYYSLVIMTFASHSFPPVLYTGVRGGAIGWGTEPQAGRSRVHSRWGHWDFSLTESFRPHYGPGVDSFSNRNGTQGYFLGGEGVQCLGKTTLPRPYANFLKILGAWASWSPRSLSRSSFTLFTFTHIRHKEISGTKSDVLLTKMFIIQKSGNLLTDPFYMFCMYRKTVDFTKH